MECLLGEAVTAATAFLAATCLTWSQMAPKIASIAVGFLIGGSSSSSGCSSVAKVRLILSQIFLLLCNLLRRHGLQQGQQL